jgi:phosphate-selective porin OprO/OprP
MKLVHFTHKALLGLCGATLLVTATAKAGKEAKLVVEEPESLTFDDIWGLATLYQGDKSTFIQSFAFSGRLQADAAFFYPSEYDEYEKMLWRRFRAGFKTKFLNQFTLHTEAGFDLNDWDSDDLGNIYSRLTDVYLGWKPSDAFNLKIGKHSAPFTMDGWTSSKELIRLERSNLTNNLWFPEEYHAGIAADGKIGKWEYKVGIYSSAGEPEFGDFDAGYFGLLSIGYNFDDAWDMDKALLRLDYVYNDENVNNGGTRDLGQVVSFNTQLEKGKLGIRTDFAAGEGYGEQSNLFAISLIPFYDITEKWQAVVSYNYAASDGPNGVYLDRYENRTTDGRADEVHEFFAGLNHYLYGHKLKWQNGVEYTTASDSANDGGAYNGWGFTSGIRLSW